MSEEKEKENQKQAEELSAEDLKQVTGGASDIFAKIGDIKGESLDDKHRDQRAILVSPVTAGIKMRQP